MYQIDFLTCTMRDVITRSAVCHPSLFAESMRSAAKVHAEYAVVTHNATVARIARRMSVSLNSMARDLTLDRFDANVLDLGEVIQAFGIAAKLNLVPRSCRDGIVSRGV
jgi:hypothetical protein